MCIVSSTILGCWGDSQAVATLRSEAEQTRQAIAAAKFQVDSLTKRLADAESTIQAMQSAISLVDAKQTKGFVDLTVPRLQALDETFYLSKAEVSTYLGGVRVRGNIVNASALGHASATFRFQLAAAERDVFLSSIPSGGSSRFEVVFPEVQPVDARFATIEYKDSTLTYARPR